MDKLALLGGSPAVPRGAGRVEWPVVTPADEEAVLRVMRGGGFTCITPGGGEVRALEEEWADFVGTRHCVAVSNGTAAISLALSALGIAPGDEVLVPALSFVATAVAPLHALAIPVFVDIDPRTFNIDPQRIAEKITPSTRAIVVVHLHGLPADMSEIWAVARKHRLAVVEDAAQAHGATYKGKRTGALGDIATFSLNVSKNLPTCGEGGLVTMDRPELYDRVLMLRQFGEILKDGEERTYVHHVLGWNQKLSSLQAAFSRSQLSRFAEYQEARDRNVTLFLEALADLPGVVRPITPTDRTHAWHIVRLRFDPALAGLDDVTPGAFRRAVQRALRAEGVPLTEYQKVALPGQALFQTQDGFGRGYPWTLSSRTHRYRADDYPVTQAVIDDSLTLQRVHLNPASGPLLKAYADAFQKVYANLDVVARMARALPGESTKPFTRASSAN